jgi:hypothetical protein
VKTLTTYSVALTVATLVSAGIAFAEDGQDEDHDGGKTYVVEGRVTTGYNMLKGEVMYDLGGIVGAQGFNYVFVYEPGKSQPSIITTSTDENRLVATGIDAAFYAAVGVDPSVIDPHVVNLPFRDLPIVVNGLTGAKEKLGPITAQNYKSAFTRAMPSKPITIADWFSVRASAHIRCESSTAARAVLTFRSLIPNGVYAVWGIFGQSLAHNGVRDFFSPKPLGGSPNVFTADDRGNAVFARDLPFCPSTDPDMMTVEVTYEVDGVTYGAVPSISPLVSNGNSYLATPTQVSFNVGGLKSAH